jgi:hypothetical protein
MEPYNCRDHMALNGLIKNGGLRKRFWSVKKN